MKLKFQRTYVLKKILLWHARIRFKRKKLRIRHPAKYDKKRESIYFQTEIPWPVVEGAVMQTVNFISGLALKLIDRLPNAFISLVMDIFSLKLLFFILTRYQ